MVLGRSPALDVQSGRDQRSGGRGHLSGRQPIAPQQPDTTARGATGSRTGSMNPLNAIKSLVDTATARGSHNCCAPCPASPPTTPEYEEQKFASEISRVLRRKMGSGEMEVLASLVIRDFIVAARAGMVARFRRRRRVRARADLRDDRVRSSRVSAQSAAQHRARVRPENSRRTRSSCVIPSAPTRSPARSPTRDRTRGSR